MMKGPEQAIGEEHQSSTRRVSDAKHNGPKRKKRKTHGERQSEMPQAPPARLSSTNARAISDKGGSSSSFGSRDPPDESSSASDSSRTSSAGSGSDRQQDKKPNGVILKSGRVRLPDKLMEFLVKEVVPDVLYWQKDGSSFSFDTKTAQEKLLDRYFSGTKLSSFTRSLNRWGFKRVFHALAPKDVLSYEHPSFTKENPEKVKDMKMAVANDGNNALKSKTPPPAAAAAAAAPSVAPSCAAAGQPPPAFVSFAQSSFMPTAAASASMGSPTSRTTGNTANVEALTLMADAASSLQNASSAASNGMASQGFMHVPSQVPRQSSPALSPASAPALTLSASALLRTLALAQSTSGASGTIGGQNQSHALQAFLMSRLQSSNTSAPSQQPQPQPPMDLTALIQAAFASGQASALAAQQAQAAAPQPVAPPAPTGQTLAMLLRQQPSLLQRQDIQALLLQNHQPPQQQPALAAPLSSSFPAPSSAAIQQGFFSAPAQHNEHQNQAVMSLVLGLLNNQNQNQH